MNFLCRATISSLRDLVAPGTAGGGVTGVVTKLSSQARLGCRRVYDEELDAASGETRSNASGNE
jgi:hypothetical protein